MMMTSFRAATNLIAIKSIWTMTSLSIDMIRCIIEELAMELSSDRELHSLEKMVDRIKTEIWG